MYFQYAPIVTNCSLALVKTMDIWVLAVGQIRCGGRGLQPGAGHARQDGGLGRDPRGAKLRALAPCRIH